MVALWIPLPKLSSPTIALFALVVIYGVVKKKLRFQWNWILFGFCSLYVLYALYVLPSNHVDIGMKYLEYKLSLLVFPILFSFRPTFIVDRNKMLNAFSIACLILGLFYVIQSLYHFWLTGKSSYFHSSLFASNHHPSYVAAFFSFVIYYLFIEFPRMTSNVCKTTSIGIMIFLMLLHLPLESLSGIIVLGFLLTSVVLSWAWKNLSKWVFGAVILCGLFSLQVLFWIKPSLKDNLSHTTSLVTRYIHSPSDFIKENPAGMSGNQSRLVIWTITGEIILEHPFGVGLGNLEDEMQQKLEVLNQSELMEKNYNPHNQFLQIFAEIGLIGILLFIAVLYFAVRQARKQKDVLYLFLIFSLVINCLFESMLQRQSGIVFYIVFITLFATILQKQTVQQLEPEA
jgi:O-antigen ligase